MDSNQPTARSLPRSRLDTRVVIDAETGQVREMPTVLAVCCGEITSRFSHYVIQVSHSNVLTAIDSFQGKPLVMVVNTFKAVYESLVKWTDAELSRHRTATSREFIQWCSEVIRFASSLSARICLSSISPRPAKSVRTRDLTT
jgi:hypothetical protein